MATIENPVLNAGMGDGLKVQLSKVIKAKRERVFEAWTKPEMIRKWFGPEGMRCSDATTDVRVGGQYRIEVTGPTGDGDGAEQRVAVATGVYREIVPNELLQFTWVGTWNPDEESLVTVSLKDVEGGTEVTVTHERVATEQSMKGYELGWTGCLEKLEQMFN